ncbi:hypothetical protein HPB51_013891 [Rhipicephalus microplus]|uniref:Uncharacterized protein n=1 Tax=Rhipicephalus microplus TaxID=6941 RepID=A0A9J6EGI9_RHIMP|nr:hypothetical protein HPB51_013891 [Rhipicephalus microplus]
MEVFTRTPVTVDDEICVKVQVGEITPEEYHNKAGWMLVGERMSRLRRRAPASGVPDGPGPKVPNFVQYGVTLTPCNLYRKQIDVCQQCGGVVHGKNLCRTPAIKTCLACGLGDPKDDYSCTPKCKLCGGEHSNGDRTFRTKNKMPYVVRKRQSVRRQAERQPLSENDFLSLDKLPVAR